MKDPSDHQLHAISLAAATEVHLPRETRTGVFPSKDWIPTNLPACCPLVNLLSCFLHIVKPQTVTHPMCIFQRGQVA